MTKTLTLNYHGRVLEHLGLQLYQKPEAAISELIANAWDADSSIAHVVVDRDADDAPDTISIIDDGIGMSFDQCQERFLEVGYERRKGKTKEKTPGDRTVLGRKGLGKLAGFGIAKVIRISTVSKETGEKTVFRMDFDSLMISTDVEVIEYVDKIEGVQSGTTITLSSLVNPLALDFDAIRLSIARRFLTGVYLGGFEVKIDGQLLPEAINSEEVEFVFPIESGPRGLLITDGWGMEQVSGQTVYWKFQFFKDPIQEEELRGVSVFANGKMIQSPFTFNLRGGISGQHGIEYLFGQVRADYLDEFVFDPIGPERQRVNWDLVETQALAQWGRERIKETTAEWKRLRAEERTRELESSLEDFANRLNAIPKSERKTVKGALLKLAQVPSLSQKRFREVGNAVLTAWEQGRLRNLIAEIEELDDPSEESLIEILTEAEVLTNLQLAEIIRTKIEAIKTLNELVGKRELENKLRDHIADKPYLLSPQYETFKVETKVTSILSEAADKSGLAGDDYKGRIDLALSSGKELLVVEFMRPGLALDYDHVGRCERYIAIIKEKVKANSNLGFESVAGLIVADKLTNADGMSIKIEDMNKVGIKATEWKPLFDTAVAQWQEFWSVVQARSPKDSRIDSIPSLD